MARMHSRRRGVSGSAKPASAPSWATKKAGEIEALVVKLAKQEMSSSKIGLVLRDSYGIPDVEKLAGKKITKILKEKELYGDVPEDLSNLVKRAAGIKKHLETNKKDMHSKRGLQLVESKIRRLEKYHKRTRRLNASWKYGAV